MNDICLNWNFRLITSIVSNVLVQLVQIFVNDRFPIWGSMISLYFRDQAINIKQPAWVPFSVY